ncbi:cellulose binding domain-containing protein [Sphaerisporangium sp. TRM90804]|uniref:cellulose binding domain-containing protein n=1 Tax=Sphaerisporangium sp. TRM90804 TaxID=3031113 RepID=UPI00244C3DF4|nr:cellulose binding domain-containing protein [Sphaerisporangium sp. TRM90804]MDH2429270.1 cellulose binding domain-containing protein [Sphaerisporangium sp. TRM90804]
MELRAPRSWAALAAASLALALTVVPGAHGTASAASASGFGAASGARAAADTTPPSKPTGFRDRCSSDFEGVLFCWEPSTDDVGVVAYDVQRQTVTGYVKVGTSPYPIFHDGDVVIGTSYTYIVVARDAAGNLSEPSDPFVALARDDLPDPSPSPTPTRTEPVSNCHVKYEPEARRTGQNARVTISNTGTTPINGWTLVITWAPPAPRLISGYWATWSQTGTRFNARHLAWNRVIPPGGSVQAGFTAVHRGMAPTPGGFYLNDVSCSSEVWPPS